MRSVIFICVFLAGLGLIIPGWELLVLPLAIHNLVFSYAVLRVTIDVCAVGDLFLFFSELHSEPCECGEVHPVLSNYTDTPSAWLAWGSLYLPLVIGLALLNQPLWSLLILITTGLSVYYIHMELAFLEERANPSD